MTADSVRVWKGRDDGIREMPECSWCGVTLLSDRAFCSPRCNEAWWESFKLERQHLDGSPDAQR